MSEKKEYQQVFKATSLFGSVQILKIIISALKSKAAVIFLDSDLSPICTLFSFSMCFLAVSALRLSFMDSAFHNYLFFVVLLILFGSYSYYQLNKRINFRDLLKGRGKNKKDD